MPVTDFECAIARSQISRIINGENLGEEVENQLESHIDVCEKCRLHLEDRKRALEASIVGNQPESSGATPSDVPAFLTKAIDDPVQTTKQELRSRLKLRKSTPKGEVASTDVQNKALKEHLQQTEIIDLHQKSKTIKSRLQEREAGNHISKSGEKKQSFWSKLALYRVVDSPINPETGEPAVISVKALKQANRQLKKEENFAKPLYLMLGLAIIVGAMSFIVKDPTKLLGTRVSDSLLNEKAKPAASVAVTRTAAQEFVSFAQPKAETKPIQPKPLPKSAPNGVTTAVAVATDMVAELFEIKVPKEEAKPVTKPKSDPVEILAQQIPKRSSGAKKLGTKSKRKSSRIVPPSPKKAFSNRISKPRRKPAPRQDSFDSDSTVRIYDSKGNPIQ